MRLSPWLSVPTAHPSLEDTIAMSLSVLGMGLLVGGMPARLTSFHDVPSKCSRNTRCPQFGTPPPGTRPAIHPLVDETMVSAVTSPGALWLQRVHEPLE